MTASRSDRDWWARFRAKASPPDPVTGCVRWKGAHDKLGYGRFSFEGKAQYAHVMAFYHKEGRWPQSKHYVVRRGTCARDCVCEGHLEEREHAYNPDMYSVEHRRRNVTRVSLGRNGAATARKLWDEGATAQVISVLLGCPPSTAYKAAAGRTWRDDSATENRVVRRRAARRARELQEAGL